MNLLLPLLLDKLMGTKVMRKMQQFSKQKMIERCLSNTFNCYKSWRQLSF